MASSYTDYFFITFEKDSIDFLNAIPAVHIPATARAMFSILFIVLLFITNVFKTEAVRS